MEVLVVANVNARRRRTASPSIAAAMTQATNGPRAAGSQQRRYAPRKASARKRSPTNALPRFAPVIGDSSVAAGSRVAAKGNTSIKRRKYSCAAATIRSVSASPTAAREVAISDAISACNLSAGTNASVRMISRATRAIQARRDPTSDIESEPSEPNDQRDPTFDDAAAGKVTDEREIRLAREEIPRENVHLPFGEVARHRAAEMRQVVVGALGKHLAVREGLDLRRSDSPLHELDRFFPRDTKGDHVVRVLQHHVA